MSCCETKTVPRIVDINRICIRRKESPITGLTISGSTLTAVKQNGDSQTIELPTLNDVNIYDATGNTLVATVTTKGA